MIETLSAWFSHPTFIVIAGFSTLLTLGVTVWIAVATLWSLYNGVKPVIWRLGMGLSNRKIAIFANIDQFSTLETLLLDSGLFRKKNIVRIPPDSLKKAAEYSLFLLYWKDFSEQIDEVLRLKNDATGLVIYAPQEEALVPKETIQLINQHRNTLLVNFRGRLLNDILVLMITTNYAKKSA